MTPNELLSRDQSRNNVQLQNAIEDAVVQVFTQAVPFNWREPYRVSDQFEHRGSGFLINEDGYIVTSAHVVDEAKSLWIQMPAFGHKTFFVDIVGFCPERDLALLRMQEEDRTFLQATLGRIPWLPLGDSDSVNRTDPIMVLGYPLGQYRIKTLTGVISGWESGAARSFIQITAPINPGNSGGPLVDAQGHVIGVAIAAIFPAQNIGYALPINELRQVLPDLMTQRFVRRPTLGIAFAFANDALAMSLKNPTPAGLYINKVLPNSLAQKAGLLSGDMLYELNGMRIDAFGDASVPWTREKVSLHDIISRLSVGDQLQLLIYRKGTQKEILLTVTLQPPYPIRICYPDYEKIDYEVIAGTVIMQLTENHIAELIQEAPYLLQYTKIENKVDPVLVISHILPGSAAQLVRSIQPGWIIHELNQIPVRSLAEFRAALRKSLETGLLTLKTNDQVMAAFILKQILVDEQHLAAYFGYRLSETVQELLTPTENRQIQSF